MERDFVYDLPIMGEIITTEAVIAATGKSWPEWYAELEASPVKKEGLTSVTTWLTEQNPSIGGWWCQIITRRWEAERTLLASAE